MSGFFPSASELRKTAAEQWAQSEDGRRFIALLKLKAREGAVPSVRTQDVSSYAGSVPTYVLLHLEENGYTVDGGDAKWREQVLFPGTLTISWRN
jgi:hypothetical protein